MKHKQLMLIDTHQLGQVLADVLVQDQLVQPLRSILHGRKLSSNLFEVTTSNSNIILVQAKRNILRPDVSNAQ